MRLGRRGEIAAETTWVCVTETWKAGEGWCDRSQACEECCESLDSERERVHWSLERVLMSFSLQSTLKYNSFLKHMNTPLRALFKTSSSGKCMCYVMVSQDDEQEGTSMIKKDAIGSKWEWFKECLEGTAFECSVMWTGASVSCRVRLTASNVRRMREFRPREKKSRVI